MALLDSLVVFVVSLLVGGFGLYVGGRVVAGYDDYGYALVTALVGAVVWAIVGFFLGWVPLFGPLAVLFAYVTVIRLRYPGGYVDAVIISLVAWGASLVVLYVLAILGVAAFEAVGVPGV